MAVNFEYYKVFYYVAKYGNLTRAANVLMSNQPNVTRVMNNLEYELGCKLISRSNRGIRLTAEGDRLYRHVSAAFEQFKLGEEELQQSLSLQSGTVFIGATETALHSFLIDKLGIFHREYPKVRLKIFNYVVKEAIQALQDQKVELAVVACPVETDSHLQQIPLKPFRDILAGGEQFRELASSPLPLSELGKYPLITLNRDTTTYEYYRKLFWNRGFLLEPDVEVETSDLVLPMIKNNLGLGFLPEFFAKEALEAGKIVEIPLEEPLPERQICLVTDTRHPLSVAAKSLCKMLTEDSNGCILR